MPRNVVHIEIPTADQSASREFYKELCGWGVQNVPMPQGGEYTTFSDSNTGLALSPVGEHVKPGDVLVYLHSDDIDADLKQAESLGATVVTPRTEITGFGALGVFRDPTGNQVAFWQSASQE